MWTQPAYFNLSFSYPDLLKSVGPWTFGPPFTRVILPWLQLLNCRKLNLTLLLFFMLTFNVVLLYHCPRLDGVVEYSQNAPPHYLCACSKPETCNPVDIIFIFECYLFYIVNLFGQLFFTFEYHPICLWDLLQLVLWCTYLFI